jgi:hypothetical protein
MSIERSLIRAVFALYPDLSSRGIWALINDITNHRQREDEIEFVDKKTSRRRNNEASGIRAALQEHRAVLGLVNPAKRLHIRKKIRKDTITSSCAISCFWTENSNARPKRSWVREK